MRAFAMGFAALMICAAPTFGEPSKRDAPKPVTEPQRPTAVVLASADTVRAPAPASSPATPPAKRVIPRITTCRCGDQQAEPEDQPQ